MSTGRKDDQNKPRMDLIPPESLWALAVVLGFGARKYGDRNWECGMRWSRYYAALLRHLIAWWGGENDDPESGMPHLWHVLCCAVFLVTYEDRGIGEDDRVLHPDTSLQQ